MAFKEKYKKSYKKDESYDRESYVKNHNESKQENDKNHKNQVIQDRPQKHGYKRQIPHHLKQEVNEKKFNSMKEKYESMQEKPQKNNKKQKYIKSSEKEQAIEKEFDSDKVGTLTQQLYQKFKSNSIECLICLNMITINQQIWSCKQCFYPFHLRCTKIWIEKNNKDQKIQYNEYAWTCPKCCYNYSESMPNYYCFCGSVREPEYDNYSLPHSCGEQCKRQKDCQHPCPLPCHPGPCPPCNFTKIDVACFCGKQMRQVHCGESSQKFECSQICDKKLNCSLHRCQLPCHMGPCPPCEKQEEVDCNCGSEQRLLPCNSKPFSCMKPCENLLNCNNHYCDQVCHAGPCQSCDKTPNRVKTCPCGKSLLKIERQSCLDPIPVCNDICRKKLPCGEHFCPEQCHEGPCPPCQNKVSQKCVCGASKRKVICSQQNEFRCYKPCNKYKSCKVHRCQNECCEARQQDNNGIHLCLKVCGKKLNCGKHECGLFCHLGNCQNCPIYIQDDLTCVCKAQVIKGPLPCGTLPPDCDQPCSRQRPCGHKCPINCHVDNCPPCRELVSKPCRCGKEIIQNVACSNNNVSCGKPCKKMLPCKHLCDQICHTGDCEQQNKCKQKCLKVKKCSHKCIMECHEGEPCPENNCQTKVKVICKCGNRYSFISCQEYLENDCNVVAPCNDFCKNLQRFGSMFDQQKTYYPAQLVKFARKHFQFIQKLEYKIEEMIKDGKEYLDIPIMNDEYNKKKNLELLLQQNYRADFDAYYHIKPPFISLKNNQQLRLPNIKLTYYLKQIMNGNIKPDILPFDCTIRFIHLTKFDTIEDLNYILKDYQGLYYAERQSEKILLLHFWSQDHGDNASKRLKKQVGSFNQFVMDVNFKLLQEDKKLSDISNQMKLTQQELKKQINQQKLQQQIDNPPQIQPKTQSAEQNVYALLDEENDSNNRQVNRKSTDQEDDESDKENDQSQKIKKDNEPDEDGFIQVVKN